MMICPVQPQSTSALVDGLAHWESEACVHAPALSLIRLDSTERLLVPFTHLMAIAQVHYIDTASIRSYSRCNGTDCLLCRTGYSKDSRDLWPIYDLVDQSVGVLAITPNMRPFALRPQLIPIIRKAKAGTDRLLLTISNDRQRFSVSSTPLPADVEDGSAKIKQFMDKLHAGEIDLGSVYPRYDNADLISLPELATRLAAKGIKAE